MRLLTSNGLNVPDFPAAFAPQDGAPVGKLLNLELVVAVLGPRTSAIEDGVGTDTDIDIGIGLWLLVLLGAAAAASALLRVRRGTGAVGVSALDGDGVLAAAAEASLVEPGVRAVRAQGDTGALAVKLRAVCTLAARSFPLGPLSLLPRGGAPARPSSA